MWLANGRVWVCFGGMTGLPLRTISIWTMMVLCAVATAGCMGALAPEEMETGPKRTYSKLWGRQGEVWLPGGRLPDFSYAGYRSGEREIPDYPVATDVTAFGARGDDDADDTAAFKAAIAATEAGAVFVPAGRYVITEVLRITKPGVVLRGEDGGRTRLFFPKPLQEIEPNTGATTGEESATRSSNRSPEAKTRSPSRSTVPASPSTLKWRGPTSTSTTPPRPETGEATLSITKRRALAISTTIRGTLAAAASMPRRASSRCVGEGLADSARKASKLRFASNGRLERSAHCAIFKSTDGCRLRESA